VTTSLLAGLIGLLAASGRFIGALVGYTERLPHRLIATVMGFGAGVLVPVLTLELVAESGERGSILATAGGFMGGALLFSLGNWLLERRGAADRKRCGVCVPQPSEAEIPGSGLAIAVGALIDGIPESLAIGLSTAAVMPLEAGQAGTSLPVALVAGFFLANIPQGISSTSGMHHAGRSPKYVLGVMADNGEPLVAKLGHQLCQVVCEGCGVVPVRRLLGQSNTSLVGHDDCEVLGQSRHQEPPCVPVLGPAVHHQQRRSVATDDHVLADSVGLTNRLLNVLVNLLGSRGELRTEPKSPGTCFEAAAADTVHGASSDMLVAAATPPTNARRDSPRC